MGDYCNVTTTCNLGTGNITFTGTGTTTFNATPTSKAGSKFKSYSDFSTEGIAGIKTKTISRSEVYAITITKTNSKNRFKTNSGINAKAKFLFGINAKPKDKAKSGLRSTTNART